MSAQRPRRQRSKLCSTRERPRPRRDHIVLHRGFVLDTPTGSGWSAATARGEFQARFDGSRHPLRSARHSTCAIAGCPSGRSAGRDRPRADRGARVRPVRVSGGKISRKDAFWKIVAVSGLEQLDGLPEGSSSSTCRPPGPRPCRCGTARPPREPVDLRVDVLDDEVDAVPAAGFGHGAVGHRAPGRALRPAQQQAQLAARDVGERRAALRRRFEPEVPRVEVDRRVDVVDHVAHADQVSSVGMCASSL